jgi:hypothetical protein
MKREELSNYYWGTSGTPDQWHTLAQCAEKFSTDIDDILECMKKHNIGIRNEIDRAERKIWDLLVGDYNFVYGTHFEYSEKYEPNSGLPFFVNFLMSFGGIQIVNCVMVDDIMIHHIGNDVIIKVSCLNHETMIRVLERELAELGIKPMSQIEEDDESEW